MVEFLKAKPTTFLNKRVGIVNADTGAIQAANTLANVANKIASEQFKQATLDEKKFGENYALSLPTRDLNGDLKFEKLDKNLSAVAREAAEPIRRKQYAEALSVDIYNNLNEIRLNSKTSDEFNSKTNAFMGEYINQISNVGGKEYANLITENIAKLGSQHFYAMATEERKKELRIASLNSLAINEKTTDELEAYLINEFNNMQEGTEIQTIDRLLKEQENEIEQLLASNNANLKDFNLNPAKHSAQDLQINSVTGRALVKAAFNDTKYTNLLSIYRHIDQGSELDYDKMSAGADGNVDENKKRVLAKIVNFVKQSAYKDEILKTMDTMLVSQGKLEGKIKADEAYERKNKELILEKEKELPENRLSAPKFFKQMDFAGSELLKEYEENNFIVTDNIVSRLNSITSRILKSGTKEGLQLNDGSKVFLSNAGSLQLLSKVTGKVFMDHIVNSGEFTDVDSMNKLRVAMTNLDQNDDPEVRFLSGGQKTVIEQMMPLINKINLPKTDVFSAIDQEFTRRKERLVAQNKSAATTQKNNSIVTNAITGTFGSYTDKKGIVLDDALIGEYNPNYFNTFLDNLENSVGDTNRNARLIDLSIVNKAHPKSFKNFMERSVSGTNTNIQQIQTAISLYKRYSTYNVNGTPIDVLSGVLDKKTHSILTIASNIIPNYKGADDFLGIRNPNAASMMTRIVDAYNNKDTDENKSRLKGIMGGNFTRSYDYLRTLGFDAQDAKDLQFIPEIAANLMMTEADTKTLLLDIQENLYPDGEGLIVDVLTSSNNSTKSKFSMLRSFADPINGASDRAYIRDKINKDLLDLQVVDKIGDVKGSYLLNYKPAQITGGKEIGLGITVGGERTTPLGAKDPSQEFESGDVPVYLHPYGEGSDLMNHKYMLVVKSGNSFQPLSHPTKGLMIYDVRELKKEIDGIRLEQQGD